MRVLYIGDIVARLGRRAVKEILPPLKKREEIDFVIAQGENLSTGNGMRIEAIEEMQAAGVDFFTGGNHSWRKREFLPYLDDPKVPVIRPANYPEGAPGRGYQVVNTPKGHALIINLMGQVIGGPQLENPLRTIDKILKAHEALTLSAIIVDFHADYSSEKVAIGYYLDGRVSAVVGSHTHVPTADARRLPGGTAVISDAGMVGGRGTVLGVEKEIVIGRWLDQLPAKHENPTTGECDFGAVLIDVTDRKSASGIRQIQEVISIS